LTANKENYMTSTIEIRRANIDDAAALAQLAEQTFIDTYGPYCDANTVREHCQRNFGIIQQSKEIQNSEGFSLLQYADEELLGFVQMKQIEAPACVLLATERPTICLHRYYVKQSWHGKGIALPLLEYAIDLAKSMGAKAIWLNMWQQNERAFAFYKKHGFSLVGEMDYLFGSQVEQDHVLLKVI
jgi:GNAT superfamily N-acetyltransferase